MKPTLVLVLLFVCCSVEADFNLNWEIVRGLSKFNNTAWITNNFTVNVPSFSKVNYECNFSRELMNILDHLVAPGGETELNKLKTNVGWLEERQPTLQSCPMKKALSRKVSFVFSKYKQLIQRLNGTKTKRELSVTEM